MPAKYKSLRDSESDFEEEVTLLNQNETDHDSEADHDAEKDSWKSEVRTHNSSPKRKGIRFDLWILLVVLLLFAVAVGLALKFVVIPRLSPHIPALAKHGKEPLWRQINLPDEGSESCIRLMDVNDDGADDIILGVAQLANFKFIVNQPDYCTDYKFPVVDDDGQIQDYRTGCLGSINAYDGMTGKMLWQIPTLNEVFGLNCGNIDVNLDGRSDCVGGGRRGTYLAFDPRTGKHLWPTQKPNETHIVRAWNNYTPLIIRDITDDGVPEVMLSHGGDPDIEPEVFDRHPGRIIVLDGASGEFIGNWIDMPDKRETYSSPVLHTDKSGTEYVIIGTGGETIPGSLYIIALDDVTRGIHNETVTANMLKGIPSDGAGFFPLVRAKMKGVMVPVVLVDINNDGCNDIFFSTFDGQFALFDGDTFSTIWTKTVEDTECYTTPAVGYFNPDDTLDFMVHNNYGSWPHYNRSTIVVYSGDDGKELWTYNTSRMSFTSDLVVKTKSRQDMFIFRVQGRSGPLIDDGIGVIHGIDPQRTLGKKSRSKRGFPACSDNLENLASEVFLVDWNSRFAPKRIFRRDADKFTYNPDEIKYNPNELRKRHTDSKPSLCRVLEQSSRTTGALGDIDNDGRIDLVMSFNGDGPLFKRDGSYVTSKTVLDITSSYIDREYESYPNIDTRSENSITISHSVEMLPLDQQIWTGYMGWDGTSIYRDRKPPGKQ